LDRLLMLLVALIDEAAAVQRLGVVGIDRERLLELGPRFLGLARARQRPAVYGNPLRFADVLGGDLGRWLRDGFRLRFLVRSQRPRAQIERAAAKHQRKQRGEPRSPAKGVGR